MELLVESLVVTALYVFSIRHEFSDEILVKIDITALLYKIIIVCTFKWAQVARDLCGGCQNGDTVDTEHEP